MAGKKWSVKENKILRKIYSQNTSKESILERLQGRTWDAIKIQAEKLRLKYYKGTNPQVGAKLDVLLQEKLESYYWMGFLAADGNFSEDQRLTLTLAIRDKEHVSDFCNYISCSGHRECRFGTAYTVSIKDQYNIPKISEKFDLKPRKTYDPPSNLNWLIKNKLIAFFIGYTDGDGSIGFQSGRKDCFLRIKIHRSWRKILDYMIKNICRYAGIKPPKVKINKYGYTEVSLCNIIVLRFLKKKTKELYLPVLERKWDKIDEKIVSRYEKADINKYRVLKLKNKGMRQTDISKELHLSESAVHNIIHRKTKARSWLIG